MSQHIANFSEAEAALLPYVPLVAQLSGKDTVLDRIRPLMDMLGNPQEKILAVHIAGTSGKTSTACFTAALLKASGKRVGLTVSPHVDSVAERVQIDGLPLAERDFCDLLAEFLEIVERAPQKPSYFELLYAFSFWVFVRQKVEYAVIETGMGGLHDATNVIERPDKVCIITDIGYDHMHILGDTLDLIAAQKAGIIHPHNPVIMYEQAPNITKVFREQAEACQSELILTSEEAERKAFGHDLPTTMPLFQQRNWLLAYRAYTFVAARDDLPDLRSELLLASQSIQVPGRMDIRQIGDKTIVMDGAHNGQKMATFLDSFRAVFPDAKPAIMVTLKQGKEPQDVGPLLASIAGRIIVTEFKTSQDLPAKSIPAEELTEEFQKAGSCCVEAEIDLDLAYQALLAAPEKVCIITGSFYLLSQLRHNNPELR